MQSQLFYYATLLSVIFKTSESACVGKSNTAILTALLPLHKGNDCSVVELRGLQQAAALQATINSISPDIKRESNLIINLKIQDTCSNEDGAVKAALKSMVDSDLTCLHAPFFMGFIGPEVKEISQAVHKVTKLFNATHVVPYSFEGEETEEAILHVTSKQSQSQAKSIIAVLRKLQWTTISLAVDQSPSSHTLAKNILELLQGDQSLCIIDNVARISDSKSISEALNGITGHGIVVLADSAEVAVDVLEVNKHLAIPMVIFIKEIGLRSWQIPSFNATLVILQETLSEPIDGVAETINASLHSLFIKQQDQLIREKHCKGVTDVTTCMKNKAKDAFQGILDPSLLPISYAARMMASNLLVAHKAKCRMAGAEGPVPGLCSKLSHLSQGEWRNLLQTSTAFIKKSQNGNLPTRIHFQMEITCTLDIFARNHISLVIEKIGQVTNNGNNVNFLTDYTFSSLPTNDKVKTKICPDNSNLRTVPTIWSETPKATPGVLSEPVESIPEEEFFEMVTLICGAGFGILIFFVIMTYVVYSSFKVKTEKQSSAGSPTFQRKTSRIARWRRGSGQSSRASIRTID